MDKSCFSGKTVQRLQGALLAAVVAMTVMGSVSAAPEGGRVRGGKADISEGADGVVIDQHSKNLAIDWDSFDIAADEQVQFRQPNSNSVALNRINGQKPSQIFGAIYANGKVFLVNSNGILFGPDAMVNVNGLVASSLSIDIDDFMAERYHFAGDPEQASAIIVNRGTLRAATGGSIALFGGAVTNEGLILAHKGTAVLASGQEVTLDFDGDGLIRFVVDGRLLKGAVSAGSDGEILIPPQQARRIFDAAVNSEGLIPAARIEQADDGSIRLVGAAGTTVNSGTMDVSAQHGKGGEALLHGDDVRHQGRIDASGEEGGSVRLSAADRMLLEDATIDLQGHAGSGGELRINGERVALLGDTQLDASGATAGGQIDVGGGYQGQDSSQKNARLTHISSAVKIRADARVSGDGGRIVAWSDGETRIEDAAVFSARGGAVAGDGGLLETSAKEYLSIAGGAPDLGASGAAGTWLLDPANIEIVATITGTELQPNAANTVFEDEASDPLVDRTSQVLVTTLVTALGTSDVTVRADGDITVEAGISSTSNTLTLEAGGALTVSSNVEVSVASLNITAASINGESGHKLTTTGAGGMTLTANSGNIGMSSTDALNIAVGGTLTATASGNIYVTSAANLTVASVNAGYNFDSSSDGTGTVSLGTTGIANLTLGGGIDTVANDDEMILNVAGGLTVSQKITAASLNIEAASITGSGTLTTTGGMTLTANNGGNIGTSSDALNMEVGGELTATAENNNGDKGNIYVTSTVALKGRVNGKDVGIRINDSGDAAHTLSNSNSELSLVEGSNTLTLAASNALSIDVNGALTVEGGVSAASLNITAASITGSGTGVHLTTTGARGMTLTANSGGIGSSSAALNISVGGARALTATASGGAIYLNSSSNGTNSVALTVGNITAQSLNITAASITGSGTGVHLTTTGNMTLETRSTAGSTDDNNNPSYGDIGGTGSGSALNISVGGALTITQAGTVSLNSSRDGTRLEALTVGDITAQSLNIMAASITGSGTLTTTGTATAGNMTLTANSGNSGNIGSDTEALNISVGGALTATASADIYVTSAAALTVASVNAGYNFGSSSDGTGTVSLETTTAEASLTLGDGDAFSSNDHLTLNVAGGFVVSQDITAVSLNLTADSITGSGGTLTTTGTATAGNMTLTANSGGIGSSSAALNISVGGALTATASGDIYVTSAENLTVASVNANSAGSNPGTVSLETTEASLTLGDGGAFSSNDDLALNVAGDFTVSQDITAASLDIEADSITGSGTLTTTGDMTLMASNGGIGSSSAALNIAVGGALTATASGDIYVTSTADLTVANVNANSAADAPGTVDNALGTVSLETTTAEASLTLGDGDAFSSNDHLTLNVAGGFVVSQDITAVSLNLTAASITRETGYKLTTTGTAATAGNMTLTANSGNIGSDTEALNISVGGALTATASGGAIYLNSSSQSALTVGNITAQSLNITAASITGSGTGVHLTTTGARGMTLTANSGGIGSDTEALNISVGGALTATASGGAIYLNSSSQSALTVGNITAQSLNITAASITGSGTLTTTGDMTLMASNGDIGSSSAALNISVGGALTATASGGAIYLNSSSQSALTVGNITAQSLNITAASITGSGTGVHLTTTGTATAGNMTLTANSGGIGSSSAALNISVGGALTATASGGAIYLNSSSQSALTVGNITAQSLNITAASITGSGTGVHLTTTGTATAGNMTLTANSGGIGSDTEALNISVGGALTATASGDIYVTSTADLTVANVNANSADDAPGTVDNAPGTVSLETTTAEASLTLGDGDAFSSNDHLTLNVAGGFVVSQDITAVSLNLTAASITRETGYKLTTTGTATAGNMTLTANSGNIGSDTEALNIAVGGALTATASADIYVTSAAALTVASVNAGYNFGSSSDGTGTVSLETTAGALTLGDDDAFSSDDDLTLNVEGNFTVSQDVTAASLDITADSITGSGTAVHLKTTGTATAGNMTLTANSGGIGSSSAALNISVGGALTATASGDISLNSSSQSALTVGNITAQSLNITAASITGSGTGVHLTTTGTATAGNMTLTANSGGIGSSFAALNISVGGALTATASADIYVTSTAALTVADVDAQSVDITAVTITGSGTAVHLKTTGAGGLTLKVNNGKNIGTSSDERLNIAVTGGGALTAEAHGGAIYLNSVDVDNAEPTKLVFVALKVADVDAQSLDITAASITGSGTLKTTGGTDSAGENVGGNMTLTANSGNIGTSSTDALNIDVGGALTATAAEGSIYLDADGALTIGEKNTVFGAANDSEPDAAIQAAGDIYLKVGSLAQNGDIVSTSNGTITVEAGSGITMESGTETHSKDGNIVYTTTGGSIALSLLNTGAQGLQSKARYADLNGTITVTAEGGFIANSNVDDDDGDEGDTRDYVKEGDESFKVNLNAEKISLTAGGGGAIGYADKEDLVPDTWDGNYDIQDETGEQDSKKNQSALYVDSDVFTGEAQEAIEVTTDSNRYSLLFGNKINSNGQAEQLPDGVVLLLGGSAGTLVVVGGDALDIGSEAVVSLEDVGYIDSALFQDIFLYAVSDPPIKLPRDQEDEGPLEEDEEEVPLDGEEEEDDFPAAVNEGDDEEALSLLQRIW